MALSAQILHLNKVAIPQHSDALIKKALKLEDHISIHAFRHQARTLKLTRTKYELHSSDVFRKGQYGTQLWLPTLPSEAGRNIKIQLYNVRSHSTGEVFAIYEVVSEFPFKLNGQWTSRAPLKHGDIVDFGLIRLFIGKHEIAEAQRGVSQTMARSNLPILIEGETGTGKTTLAKKIHKGSEVVGRFIHLNLSAFSPSLVESELFGHTKGAFTGAHRDKTGALAMAHGGTLFLDEIDSLSRELQTKLLLFLDNGIVRPVGGVSEKKVVTRLIFASGSKLSTLVKRGEIRSDFYHRLCSGVKIVLPNLRDDSAMLEEAINSFSLKYQRAICPTLIQHYSKYTWPGNIRELNGHLYKKHILNPEGILRLDDCDEELFLGESLTRLNKENFHNLREVKKHYIDHILSRVEFNVPEAAKILGISENTVRKYL